MPRRRRKKTRTLAGSRLPVVVATLVAVVVLAVVGRAVVRDFETRGVMTTPVEAQSAAGQSAAATRHESAAAAPARVVTATLPAWVKWGAGLALPLSLAALGLALWTERDRRQRRGLRRPETESSRPRGTVPTDVVRSTEFAHVRGDLRELGDRLAALERRMLQLTATRADAPADASAPSEVRTSGEVPAAPAPPPSDDGPRRLPGALTGDDKVVLSKSSRPMVEIRWREGSRTAQVVVNPEFRFAELNADLLAAAFDIDGGLGAAYETVTPAEVEWGPNATEGRIRKHGRVRALGG